MKKILVPLVSPAILVGLFSGSANAAVNPQMNNAYPSQSQNLLINGVQPNPQTLSNQTPFVIVRGYGLCVWLSYRTDIDIKWNPMTRRWHENLSVTSWAKVVWDDGNCFGPVAPYQVNTSTAPLAPTLTGHDIWGNPQYSTQLRTHCTAYGNGVGEANAWLYRGAGYPSVGACEPPLAHVYGLSKPMAGFYSQFTTVTFGGTVFWHRPASNHRIVY